MHVLACRVDCLGKDIPCQYFMGPEAGIPRRFYLPVRVFSEFFGVSLPALGWQESW
jgi:hypothetical protein